MLPVGFAKPRMSSLLPVGICFVLGVALGARDAHAQSAVSPSFRAELALRHAPIHHQDVHTRGAHSLGGAADYITKVDFDGDDDAGNNWDNAGDPRYPLAAHAYFSVVETASHWFITYLFFHPRDWSSTFFETEHENDSEGLLLAVARDGTRFGAVRAGVTVVHSNFYSYLPPGSTWSAGRESVDGELSFTAFAGELHPITAQQAETHALKAWPYYRIRREGVVYYPSLSEAEVPSGPDDRQVMYRLHDMLAPGGLWSRRENPRLFNRFGTFAGNGSGGCGRRAIWCTKNAARASWGWNDHDDTSPTGAMANDPAALVRAYFNSRDTVSRTYLFNPFR